MKSIIIAGSGPVGSFIAVLCTHLGFQVTVYEKREEFSRNTNLKIKSEFFKKVQDVQHQLNLKTEFFSRLNKQLQEHNNNIRIKDLEEKFTKEAISQGAKYINKEVTSFRELYRQHQYSNPIILDCTGRNSTLRTNEFGRDEINMISIPLQHAMYINCKAKHTENISSLYQVIKYVSSIKLGDVVISKSKDKDDYTDITIPVFITNELACTFDREYPNINKKPLNPFNILTPVPDSIFFPISSVIGNLIVDGCIIDLNSVKVKKIYISCGYAKKRSEDNYVCLGDSAIHLAFFRSLNLGLKHALEFFVKLSMQQEVIARTDADIIKHFQLHKKVTVQVEKDAEVIGQFKIDNRHLNPIKVCPTVIKNVFLIVTKVIWYGCFSYDLTNHKTDRITNFAGVF